VFLEALLLAARAAGLSTAVDTCGFAPRERLLELAPLVDLFLFDLKLADESRHLALTGLPLAPILANLRALAESGALVWLRIPIVPGFSDDADALAESARLAQAIPGLRRVHLLPYHRTGGAKFRRLGRAYALADLRPPSPERMESLAAIFRARGLDARVGG
jgi:pyruvate formate lyase activating enzyme